MSEEKLGAPNAGSKRRSTIDSLFVRKAEPDSSAISGDRSRVRTGAIAAMGTSLKELHDRADHQKVLLAEMERGTFIADIDPHDIAASKHMDRIPIAIDPAFDRLVEDIRLNGQVAPILVRPLPEDDGGGRYEVVYGRRRLRAAKQLGIKVRAIVRSYDDDHAVIAQGGENSLRKDLSYMEKAQFAHSLLQAHYDRRVIIQALCTDKADLSRYLMVAGAVAPRFVRAIGPAPKAGRERWIKIAERLGRPGAATLADRRIAAPDFAGLDSDARFVAVLAAVAEIRPPSAQPSAWTNMRGTKAGTIEHRSDRTILTIDEKAAPDFGRYLAGRLDDLYAQFLAVNETTGG